MCPTPIGRIHTRVATLLPPAIVAVVIGLVDGKPDWIVLVGLLLLIGVALDAGLYSWLVRAQPPWLTGLLALGELALVFALASILDLDLTAAQVVGFYLVTWVIASVTKNAVLPIISLTYLESAGEFRRTEWSVPPAQASVPVIASPQEAAAAPGPVVRSASGAHAAPLELKPSPSGVQRIPEDPR